MASILSPPTSFKTRWEFQRRLRRDQRAQNSALKNSQGVETLAADNWVKGKGPELLSCGVAEGTRDSNFNSRFLPVAEPRMNHQPFCSGYSTRTYGDCPRRLLNPE